MGIFSDRPLKGGSCFNTSLKQAENREDGIAIFSDLKHAS